MIYPRAGPCVPRLLSSRQGYDPSRFRDNELTRDVLSCMKCLRSTPPPPPLIACHSTLACPLARLREAGERACHGLRSLGVSCYGFLAVRCLCSRSGKPGAGGETLQWKKRGRFVWQRVPFPAVLTEHRLPGDAIVVRRSAGVKCIDVV